MENSRLSITVRHFNDCPNWLTTVERLQRVIEEAGVDASVSLELVSTPDSAEQKDFRGSPTILVNGVDPFLNRDAPVGLSCRVYETPDGLAGAPTREQIETAVQKAINV